MTDMSVSYMTSSPLFRESSSSGRQTRLLELKPVHFSNSFQTEATAIKQDFSNFYSTSLSYFDKWYDFSDSNFHKHVALLGLKSEFTFSHLCDVDPPDKI